MSASAPVPASATDLAALVTALARRARAASFPLAQAPRAQKDAALLHLADLLLAATDELLAANARDRALAAEHGLTPAQIERLTLDAKKLAAIAEGCRQVAALPDPIGTTLDEWTRPNGLVIRKRRVPIGVIGIIFEARPNVTIDCAALCLKSGNASILRGGREIFHTNTALAALVQRALAHAGLPADAVQLIPTTDRAALNTLLKLDELIHLIIPRGGESLIRFVAENSTIPVIKHYNGVCFVYVDAAADLTMAEKILVNAKVSRPSVCNAAEQLLVHRRIAAEALPRLARALQASRPGGVELRCDPESLAILTAAAAAAETGSTLNAQRSTPNAQVKDASTGGTPVPNATDDVQAIAPASGSPLSTLSSPPNSVAAASAPASGSGSQLSTLNSQLSAASAADFRTEFLDYILGVRVVDSLAEAIATINRDSSAHSDAIITADEAAARRFLAEVDSAAVLWNASTRFNDGFEFGFGAEIGISTDRLHARGPMGLPELCSYKFEVIGTGQVRG